MSWNSDEAHEVGEISANVKTLLLAMKPVEGRLTTLERFMNRLKGGAQIVALIAMSGLGGYLLFGCAHQHITTYDATGQKQCDIRTTIIGQGRLDVLVESDQCPDTIYESEGTGLSDNAVKVVEKAVEAGVKAAIPGLP